VKRVVITQSNYIPWKGWFDQLALADELVLLDDAQYTRRDWRNRNRIRAAQATSWLTVPVEVKGRFDQRIDETRIADRSWAARHWQTIRQAYAQAQHLGAVEEQLAAAFARAGELELLSDVNRHLIEVVADLLGIDTPIRWSTDYEPEGARTERLVSLCVQAGATEYVSGPAARAYLDEELFRAEGIEVVWVRYDGYPEYRQLHGRPFEHDVSIVDLLLNLGSAGARAHMDCVTLEGNHVGA
jgi:hypothetical protein